MTPLVPLVPLVATKTVLLAATSPPSPWWYAVAGGVIGLLVGAVAFFYKRWMDRRDKKEEFLEKEDRRLSLQIQEVKEQLTNDIQEVKNTATRIDERTVRLPCLQSRGNGLSGTSQVCPEEEDNPPNKDDEEDKWPT